jgi:predicted ATPase
MLTRIEIDGFKTFRDFALDVPPFLVVLGRNASGKSNLFDAIQFLRASAGGTLLEATQQMRGDVLELFHHHVDGSPMSRMRFAVELLVPPLVTDAFGDSEEVRHTRLRYELVIDLRPAERGGRRPYVAAEHARLVKKTGDRWMRRMPPGIRDSVAVYGEARTDPLETKQHQGKPTFVLKTGSQGRPRLLPASEATATVLSSLSTAGEYPLLYALKQELQSWRLLQLDPAALRTPSSYDDPDALATSGAGLANALRRIADETTTEDRPDGVLSDVIADLTAVISGVRDLRLVDDDVRRQRHLEVTMRGEATYSARVASDGTLRALALLAALYDPRDAGLICFEEPENGLFPGRLVNFLAHLRDRVIPPTDTTSLNSRTRLRQLLVSSHSPAVLQALGPVRARARLRDDVVFVDTVTRVDPAAARSRISRVRWLRADALPDPGAPDAEWGAEDEGVSPHQIVSDSEVAEFEVRNGLAA